MDTGDFTKKTDRSALALPGSKSVCAPVKSIADLLFSRIEAGEYTHRLPAERRLAEEFGVPRNAIRSALELLEHRKVVDRRAGSGNFVHESVLESRTNGAAPSLPNVVVAENTGPLKLQTVRGIFEPELVRQAVIHTSPKNIDALRKIVERMELIHSDAEKFAQCEESFCLQLARGTENPLLIAIYQLITDVRRLSNWKAQQQKELTPARIQEGQVRYRLMYNAIELHKTEQAVEIFMAQMIDEPDGSENED